MLITLVAQAWVLIGAPGNPPDATGLGGVAVPYRMAAFEVTNPEWLELLEAVAADDPNGLYNEGMADSDRGGILRAGAPGAWTYSLKPDFDDKPANWFSWYDAARYCNWLHNGKPVGPQGPATTEDGVYDLSLPGDEIVRKPGALFFVPDHDEWYKAAYYDPASGYWDYPTQSDALPALATADAGGDVVNPGPNVANTDKGASWNGEFGNVTTVGGCQAPSPWGCLDMGGNVGEPTETLGVTIPGPPPLPTRRLRGGDFANPTLLLNKAPAFAGGLNMAAEAANIGVRIASFAAWFDVGGGLGGPTLSGDGFTTPGTTVTISLAEAPPDSTATLVVGAARIDAPFKGGTLVPSPDLLIPGLPTGPAGTLVLSDAWPPGVPPGSSLFLQMWMADLTATNGLEARTP